MEGYRKSPGDEVVWIFYVNCPALFGLYVYVVFVHVLQS